MFRVVWSLVFGLLLVSWALRAEEVPMDAKHWNLLDEGASFVRFEGRDSIQFVGNSYASYIGPEFRNGIIEFDVYLRNKGGFPGIHFREESGGNAEVFYLRPDVPEQHTATQYTPAFNSLFAWQIYMGEQFGAPAAYKYNAWNRVKLVVKGAKLDVYVNSETPILHIPNLARGDSKGGLRLQGARDQYYFSNMKITHTDDVEIVGAARAFRETPYGLITQFDVGTVAADSTLVEGAPWISEAIVAAQKWSTLSVNDLGIANLARVSGRKEGADTLLARLKIHAETARLLKFKYGFSDRITIFVNGQAVAQGDETFGSREPAYYGGVGLYATAFLPLKQGANEVIMAVSEGFGGWALMAAIEDRKNIEIR